MIQQNDDEHASQPDKESKEIVSAEPEVQKLATLGQRLKHARETHKLTQADVAECIGVSQSQISRYELDLDTPGGLGGIVLQRILTLFGITFEWLLEGRGPMEISEQALSEEARRIVEALDALPAAERRRLTTYILGMIATAQGRE